MGKVDMKELETKENLSDADFAAIQAEVLAEETGQPAPKDNELPEGEKSEEEKATEAQGLEQRAEAVGLPKDASLEEIEAKEKPEPSAEDKKAAEEKKKQEEERLINAKEEELSDEDKTKRAELVKAKDEETKRIQAEIDKEVSDYATEHKVSLDEAKADFESRGKILEKYKSDPKQLAIANLHLQRLYTKTQEDLKAVKEAKAAIPPPELTIENIIRSIDKGELTIDGKPKTREDVIGAYRKNYPNDAPETVEDEVVLRMAAKEMREGIIANRKEQLAELSVKAKDKRASLLNSLTDADKKYISEIQPILDKLPDRAIMSETFSLADTLRWAKGGVDIAKVEKEAEDRGYKRGLEQAKILGERETPAGKGSQKPSGKPKITLTPEQHKRAMNMYDGQEMTEQQKIDAFIEYEELDKPKK